MNKKFRGFRYRALIIMIIIWSILFVFPEAIVGYLMEWLALCLIGNFCLWIMVCINYSVETIYPICIKKTPKYFNKMYVYLYDSEKIPVSLIRVSYLMVFMYFFYTILMLGLSVISRGGHSDIVSNIVVWSYIAIGALLLIVAYCAVYMDMFKLRFKRINKYNIHYYFYMNCNLTRKWPTSICIGTCRVLETYMYKGKLFVTVEMKETGEVYNQVLVDSEYKEKKLHKLYEICNVKYIIC